ncbi:hypothetical protein AJ87_12500 [Rhizobium yanglingense]|nr:hypothetical protein AJ87_12500 [Rhizobium yanglingense]
MEGAGCFSAHAACNLLVFSKLLLPSGYPMINRLAALPVIFLVSLPAAAGNYRPDNGCTLDYPQSVLKNGSFKLNRRKAPVRRA